MVQQDKLSSVLRDFARTLGTDYPIQGILDHLVETIVEVLPVTGAGVTLISPGSAPHYIAASDDAALRFERLQTELGQGPCLMAYETGESVSAPDLARDDRFPLFAPKAVSSGLAAVFTFPMWQGEGRLGALDLYRDTVGRLDDRDLEAAQTLADVAAAYLLNARAREEALEVSDRFRHSALHDALTGLPNRALLQQRIEHAAHRASRSHTLAAILFADLDRFKRVNDAYGHAAGDELLVAVADRLAAVVRPGDTLARVSGDEFVFLCEELGDVADVELLAERIKAVLVAPFRLRTGELSVSASVGIAYSGPGEALTGQLVVDADVAMYQAKRAGGGAHRVIDLRAAQEAIDRSRLEQDLAQALTGQGSSSPEQAAGDLSVAYQPIVDAADGRFRGVEALLRWRHPLLGDVPALTAVSIAEQSGLIVEVGQQVLDRACRDRCSWLATDPTHPLQVSVNVSARQLLAAGFAARVGAVLSETGMDPGALVLEVTESIFIDDSERAIGVLAELKDLGVRLALDDFGTGYCSLGYLRRLLVDIVKIDRGFVSAMQSDPTTAAIMSAVTDLVHVLGMTVTAEGVETAGQRDQVRALGCDSAQGYLYAQPVDAAAIHALLGRAGGGQVHLPVRERP